MENFVLIFLGLVIGILGIVIATGHIEVIHSYNRARITDETRKPYGRTVGSGCLVMGIGIAVDGVISILKESFPPVPVIVGLVIGLVLILYGQFKYNKGIF